MLTAVQIPAFGQPSLDTFSRSHPQLPPPPGEHPKLHTFSGLGEQVHSHEQQLVAEKMMLQKCKQFSLAGITGPGLSDFGFSAWGLICQFMSIFCWTGSMFSQLFLVLPLGKWARLSEVIL